MHKPKEKKAKTVILHQEWRKGWQTPDYFVYMGRGKNKEKLMLREHTLGEPLINYLNET